MFARRLLAVFILVLPVLAFAWIAGTGLFAEATVGVEAPRYPDLKASELVSLDREQLAKALASSMEKANQMNVLWQNAKGAYDRLVYLLLGVIAALSVALAYLLWRMPSNNTVERDARNPGARPSP